jgi:hypothetical protein
LNDENTLIKTAKSSALDIRDQIRVGQKDVATLNFIRHPGKYIYRRYYLNGLRSHILAVLDPRAVAMERIGVVKDGVRRFPKARPLKMLRIFRSRFTTLGDVLHEIERFKIAYGYLGKRHLAMSNEFVVTYQIAGRSEIMLCGLQEYVPGVALDPWTPMENEYVAELVRRLIETWLSGQILLTARLRSAISKNGLHFVAAVKKMVQKSGYIPDIAGVRNLLVTLSGEIKLVDINNISAVQYCEDIFVDDKGYPVCDKSIEALFLLESHFLGRPADRNDLFYKPFLDPDRMQAVSECHTNFYRQLKQNGTREKKG